jgi:HSP20 family protein
MALIPWKPFHLYDPFEELERFFEEEFPRFTQLRGFVPSVDVYEKGNNLVVETPLAGVAPEDVEVSFENGCLVLKGETKRKTEVDEKDFYRKEVRYGSFYRKIPLPVAVDESKAEAVSEDGLLRVTIPKAASQAGPKKIKVKTTKKK